MNAKQRRRRDHARRMEERRAAKRFLRLNRGKPTGILGLYAMLVLDPNANKPDPRFNWWERDPMPDEKAEQRIKFDLRQKYT
jgi:hypothetical protein